MIFSRLGTLALVSMVQLAPALALAEEAADLCDRLAASSKDPDRKAAGVTKKQIPAARAIEACKQAAERSPKTARFRFQLGRALEAAGRPEEALEQYTRAADMGYPAGYFAMANCYGDGVGTKPNPPRAKKLMRKAVELGFPGEEYIESFIFTSVGFSVPPFFDAVYEGDLDKYNINPDGMIDYVFAVIEPFYYTEGCEGVITYDRLNALYQIMQRRMRFDVFKSLVGRGPRSYSGKGAAALDGLQFGTEQAAGYAATAVNGRADADEFARRYGCTTLIGRRFFSNYNDMLDGRRLLGIRHDDGSMARLPQPAESQATEAAPAKSDLGSEAAKPASSLDVPPEPPPTTQPIKPDPPGSAEDLLGGLWGGEAGVEGVKKQGASRTPAAGSVDMREANGARTAESVQRVVRRHASAIHRLHKLHLKSHPGVKGSLTLRLTIDASGSLTTVTPVTSTTGDPDFDGKVVAKVKSWRFEPVQGQGNDIVTVPLSFGE